VVVFREMLFGLCWSAIRDGVGTSGWGRSIFGIGGALRLVERWAVCDAEQDVRVFPASEQSGDKAAFYLIRARQIELQKRRLRLRGLGGSSKVCGIIREGTS